MNKDEKDAVLRLYEVGGSAAVLAEHPHLTAQSIRSFAKRRNLKAPSNLPRPWRAVEAPWGVPAQDLSEQLACVRLRNWRGPVMAGPLAWRIA